MRGDQRADPQPPRLVQAWEAAAPTVGSRAGTERPTARDQLAVATPTIRKKVNELSGGNQQKVVVAKGLYTDADVYIFAEPTVGVDVGAKSAIYETMRNLAKDAAVIIVSSEPEEVLGNSDRVMVIYNGKTTMEKNSGDTSLKEMLVHAISSEEAVQ